MRIVVDGELCSGQGRCYTRAPELLECDDEGFVTIKGSSMEVPPGLEDAARTAIARLPRGRHHDRGVRLQVLTKFSVRLRY